MEILPFKTKNKMEEDKINLRCKIDNDSYTEYIYKNFDIQNSEEVITDIYNFNMPNENDFNWNIGLVVGSSGSGKTTMLEKEGLTPIPEFDLRKALISNFNHLSEKEACRVLSKAGLSSVPSWLKPYNVLSNGEKSRANLAMMISKNDNISIIDEFTSVVDRTVAKAISNSVRKWIRRDNKKIVLGSCHKDIIEWLQPDWIFDMDRGEFQKKSPNQDHQYSLTYTNRPIRFGKYSKTITI